MEADKLGTFKKELEAFEHEFGASAVAKLQNIIYGRSFIVSLLIGLVQANHPKCQDETEESNKKLMSQVKAAYRAIFGESLKWRSDSENVAVLGFEVILEQEQQRYELKAGNRKQPVDNIEETSAIIAERFKLSDDNPRKKYQKFKRQNPSGELDNPELYQNMIFIKNYALMEIEGILKIFGHKFIWEE